MTISGSSLRVENLRGYAQGEISLIKKARHHFEAKVYNTTGFGPVRAAEFDVIDVERLAADTRSDLAWKNPGASGPWTPRRSSPSASRGNSRA